MGSRPLLLRHLLFFARSLPLPLYLTARSAAVFRLFRRDAPALGAEPGHEALRIFGTIFKDVSLFPKAWPRRRRATYLRKGLRVFDRVCDCQPLRRNPVAREEK